MYHERRASDFNPSQIRVILMMINFRHDGNISKILRSPRLFTKHGHFLPLHDDLDDEETRIVNGWMENEMARNSLILHFRTPGHLTRRMRNKLMKAYNGNKLTPVAPSFNIVHQNIPWYSTPKEVGVYIDKLLNRFRPAIILEIDGELVTEPAKVANSLNSYFKDKVVNL